MTTQAQAPIFIAEKAPFDAAALHGRIQTYFQYDGRRCVDPVGNMERMDSTEWATLRCYLNAGAVDYMVLSYETPIAYHTVTNGWIVCKKKHSVTTSKHQSIVRKAISDGA